MSESRLLQPPLEMFTQALGTAFKKAAPEQAAKLSEAAIAEAGIDLKVEAKESTIDGLVGAIERALT